MYLPVYLSLSTEIFVIGLKREIFEGFGIIFVAKVKENSSCLCESKGRGRCLLILCHTASLQTK